MSLFIRIPRTLTCSIMVIRLKESKMSRLMTKPTKWHVCPAKTQISLGIRPVWSESSPCAQRVAKDPSFLHADSEDSDQTGRMPRLIWVFAGCTLLVLSWGGPNHGTKTLFTFLRLITCIFFFIYNSMEENLLIQCCVLYCRKNFEIIFST